MVIEGGADSRGRGQAETIGVILIFGLVLTGAVVIVTLGSSAIGDTQDQVSEDRAEKALTQFDSKAALVALGNSDTQEVDFGTDRQSNYEVNEGEGWMRITIENQSDGSSTELVNESLGTVSYEVNDNTIAYQGGGVWKRIGANESRMVSPPEFYYRNGTLTLPIVNVTGASSLGSKASITHEETIQKYPNETAGNENPLENKLVKVTVQSQYYKGWGRYFEERTDGEVKYNHSRNIVVLTLISPVDQTKIKNAAASLSASRSFEINGNPVDSCGPPGGGNYTDSYNSSKNDYCSQSPGNKGDIVYKDLIDISGGTGGAYLRGDIASGGKVIVSGSTGAGQTDVVGNINHTTGCEAQGGSGSCSDRIVSGSGTVNNISGVDSMGSINAFINLKVDEIESDPNNDVNISGNELDFSASDTIELSSGTYYLERLKIEDDQELILKDDVTLAVEGNIVLEGSGGSGGTITLEDSATARVYVNGTDSAYVPGTSDDLKMEKSSAINVKNDTASQFRLFAKNDFNATIGESGGASDPAKYVGIIFAPPGNATGNPELRLKKGEIYGGIIVGTTVIDTAGGSIHYDTMLQSTDTLNDIKILKVTYLHVSVNRVRVD